MKMAITGSYSVTRAEQNAGVPIFMALRSPVHGFVASLTVVSGLHVKKKYGRLFWRHKRGVASPV